MQAKDIRVSIGRKDILHGVNFRAEPGKVTAIIGPNGSGKSTLLKAMTGEHEYTGEITLNGQDISALKPWELAALRGVLPQAATVAFPYTVTEIVRMGQMGGLAGDDPTLPSRALARVDLTGFGPRFYSDLSGGEQQRVQLARVLAQVWEPSPDGQPRWLFLDEPVASLDIAHQFTVLDVARDFALAGGGVVVVMHDLNLTAMFADKVTVMHQGRIAASGAPADTITRGLLQDVYGCSIDVSRAPGKDVPYLLPQMRDTGVA